MINVTNEFSDDHKKSLEEEIMEEITEKFMEKLQDMVNLKVQDALKIFEDTTNKKLEKAQKQLHGHKEDFNNYQSETKKTIK
jgi:predicted house-cleaning noncanonical NTP pyrophosphatase (MazG superfamily)